MAQTIQQHTTNCGSNHTTTILCLFALKHAYYQIGIPNATTFFLIPISSKVLKKTKKHTRNQNKSHIALLLADSQKSLT